jgi:MFS family permease
MSDVTVNGLPLTQRQRVIGLVVLIASTAISLVGQLMVSPILVFQLELRDYSASVIGLFSALGWLSILLCAPYASKIARWLGLHAAMVLSLLIPGLGLLAIALTDNPKLWALFYFLMGMGTATRWILGEALVAGLSPAQWRGKIVGLFQMLLGTSLILAPTILAWLGPKNPNSMWLALALIVIGVLLTLPMPHIDADEGVDEVTGWRTQWQTAMAYPLILIAGFVGGFFELGIASQLPIYGLALGFSASVATLLIATSGAGSALIMLPAGAAADKFSTRRLTQLCIGLLIVAGLLVPAVPGIPALAWVLAFIWGSAGGALYTLSMIEIGQKFGGTRLINATALLVLGYTLGGLLGPPLTGIAIELSPQWAMGALYTALPILALVMFRRNKHIAAPATT